MRRGLLIAAYVALTCGAASAQSPAPDRPKVEAVLEKELPKPVYDAVHSHRRAIFVSAKKVTTRNGVEYQITVKGSRKTQMVAKPDGTVLSFK